MELYKLDFPNGKTYIGITTGTAKRRFRSHCAPAHKKNPVQFAIHKYGKENIKLTVLLSVDNWELLCLAEQEAIEKLNSTVEGNGYNVTIGGEGNPLVGVYGEQRKQMDLEKRRIYLAKYNAENSNKLKQAQLDYYTKNKEKHNQKTRAYYEANKEQILKKQKARIDSKKEEIKEYRKRNKEQIAKKHKEWREKNKEKINAKRREKMNTEEGKEKQRIANEKRKNTNCPIQLAKNEQYRKNRNKKRALNKDEENAKLRAWRASKKQPKVDNSD